MLQYKTMSSCMKRSSNPKFNTNSFVTQGVPDLERPFKKAKGKKSRDNRAQMEDIGKAAQQILPEQVTTVCVIVNKESQCRH